MLTDGGSVKPRLINNWMGSVAIGLPEAVVELG